MACAHVPSVAAANATDQIAILRQSARCTCCMCCMLHVLCWTQYVAGCAVLRRSALHKGEIQGTMPHHRNSRALTRHCCVYSHSCHGLPSGISIQRSSVSRLRCVELHLLRCVARCVALRCVASVALLCRYGNTAILRAGGSTCAAACADGRRASWAQRGRADAHVRPVTVRGAGTSG